MMFYEAYAGVYFLLDSNWYDNNAFSGRIGYSDINHYHFAFIRL